MGSRDAAGLCMKTRDELVESCRPRWHELEMLLGSGKPLARRDADEISRMVALYRAVCGDLMRARSVGCGPDVTAHLDGLAARVHNLLYAPRPWRLRALWELFARDFPRTFRKSWRAFLLSGALFYLPLIAGVWLTLETPGFAESILPRSMLESAAESYRGGFDSGREAGAGSMMAGFYVYNNVGIAFRCFATGIVFGAGSIFFLVYNGLVTGAILGYVILVGSGHNILTFICGHGPFELTAIVVSGAAGLRMGWALVETGGRTRLGSLRAHSREVFELVMGAALMLLIAAGIEAFWSPSALAPPIKWGFSAFVTLLIAGYLLFAGRARQ